MKLRPILFAMTAFVVLVAACVGLAGHAAGAANVDPHIAPVFTCQTLTFDPEPGAQVHVLMEFDSTPAVAPVDTTITTAADRTVTVPHAADGTRGQYRVQLPDIFPGVWTPWEPYDCAPDEALGVTVGCSGWAVTFDHLVADEETTIHSTASFADGTVITHDDVVRGPSGSYTVDYPTVKNQGVTVHVTDTYASADTGTTLACAPVVPPVHPPAAHPPAAHPPVVTVAQPVLPGGNDEGPSLPDTGADTLWLALAGVTFVLGGGVLLWRSAAPAVE